MKTNKEDQSIKLAKEVIDLLERRMGSLKNFEDKNGYDVEKHFVRVINRAKRIVKSVK